MNDFEMYCEALDKKLDDVKREIQTKGMTDAALEYLHKITDTKKNLLKIEVLMMEKESGEGGYSNRGMSYRGNSYYQGGNSNGNSYYQGQDGNSNGFMPRYGGYDNGYSRDSAYSHLEQAMRDARSDSEREEIRALMSRLYK